MEDGKFKANLVNLELFSNQKSKEGWSSVLAQHAKKVLVQSGVLKTSKAKQNKTANTPSTTTQYPKLIHINILKAVEETMNTDC